MTDLQRDIGALEARVDEYEKRCDRSDEKVAEGFKQLQDEMRSGFGRIHARIDELSGAENRRKGAIGLVRMVFSGGVITGLYEVGKALFGGHPK
jgi:hypothetical protein